jgi:type IV pilus assembly protein PilY1
MNSISHRLCAGLVLLGLAGAASAQTVAPANIHFLLDTSSSMRELPQVVLSNHNEFFLSTNGCNNPRLDAFQSYRGWDPSFVYPVPDMGTGIGSDVGFPNLFQDSSYYSYMSWADYSSPTPTWSTKEAACQSSVINWSTTNVAEYSQCLSCLSTKGYFKTSDASYDPGRPVNPKFMFWGRFLNFNPPKYVSMRAAVKLVIKDLQRIRAGMSHFTSSTYYTALLKGQNPSCDQILYDPSSFDSNRASYINAVNGLRFTTGTPLARSLLNDGYYFTSARDVYETQFGFGTGYAYPNEFANAPLTYQSRSVCWGCQHNAVIIISDGDPTSDSLSPTVVTKLRALNGGPVYCPPTAPCGTGTSSDMGNNPSDPLDDNPNYLLDDVAKVLSTQDLQTNSPPVVGSFDTTGVQNLKVHAVGYGYNSNLLRNTAAVGGGLYYSADDTVSLRQALQTILADVQTRAATCTLLP